MSTGTNIDTEAFHEYEARGWESGKAEPYSRFFARVSDQFIEPLLDAAEVGPGARVLDIGCGPGNMTARAAERGAEPMGADFSNQMLELARGLHPEVKFVREEAQDLSFPDASFDAVVGNLVLLHLARPEVGIAEMVRVLRPAGRLALTIWDDSSRSRFTGIFLDAVTAAGASPPPGFPLGPPPLLYSDDANFSRLLTTGGLGSVAIQRVTYDCEFPSADGLWDGFIASSVRIAALINSQAAEMRQAIRRQFDRLAAEAAVGGVVRLPAVACLGSGRKPG